MKAKRFLSLIVCALLSVVAVFGSGCDLNALMSGQEKSVKEEGLIADFEDIATCTQNINFYNYFGRLQITKDENFITHGEGAGKINAMGDLHITSAAAPSFDYKLPEDERDFTNMKRITVDMYNASDRDYTVGVYLRIGSASGAKTQVWTTSLKMNTWTIVSPNFDVSLMSLGYDLDEVYGIGFEFEKVGQNYKGANDIYIDNLRVERYDKAPEAMQIELAENEICSFDKLWQTSVCFPAYYSPMPGYELQTSINTDLNYSRRGKSLKMIQPALQAGQGWGWAYLKFPRKYVEALNLKQYSGQDAFSLWVYSESDSAISISLHFWRKSSTEDRGITKTAGKGWTQLVWTIDEINAKDAGVGLITHDVSELRLVFNASQENLVLYFDEFSIIKAGQ